MDYKLIQNPLTLKVHYCTTTSIFADVERPAPLCVYVRDTSTWKQLNGPKHAVTCGRCRALAKARSRHRG